MQACLSWLRPCCSLKFSTQNAKRSWEWYPNGYWFRFPPDLWNTKRKCPLAFKREDIRVEILLLILWRQFFVLLHRNHVEICCLPRRLGCEMCEIEVRWRRTSFDCFFCCPWCHHLLSRSLQVGLDTFFCYLLWETVHYFNFINFT